MGIVKIRLMFWLSILDLNHYHGNISCMIGKHIPHFGLIASLCFRSVKLLHTLPHSNIREFVIVLTLFTRTLTIL